MYAVLSVLRALVHARRCAWTGGRSCNCRWRCGHIGRRGLSAGGSINSMAEATVLICNEREIQENFMGTFKK